ncbi:MAG: 5-formyltetrahydrofolate cyclo-ligase [Phycisphaerales bacterium]|nr:5-formyltetrahydrofolate cyclo-ligase [Phycisphaerales bacterium]
MTVTSDSIEETKAVLRSLARDRVRGLTDHERARLSGAACGAAMAWTPLATAECVLAYAPMRSEVDVTPLIEVLQRGGCRVCLPRADWARGTIEAVPVLDLESDLDLVEHGVRQPRAALASVPVESVQVVVAPGLAFDDRGGRLGRGGGFYDRLLAALPRAARAIGIAYEAQIFERIPMEGHDRAIDALATPARLLEFGATEHVGGGAAAGFDDGGTGR